MSPEKADAYLQKPINDFATATTTEQKIEKIIMQRYLRSFQQSGWGAYFDRLRTGYPEFRRPTGVALPYRWMYPQAEYNTNTTNVANAIKTQFGEGNDRISSVTWWLK